MNNIQQLARLDRSAFMAARRDHQKRLRALPIKMTRQDQSRIDAIDSPNKKPHQVWQSRHFLAMVYSDAMGDGTFVTRISIQRTELQSDGGWKDGISWDDLMKVKSEIGFSSLWAVECYPPDASVVNVANMRHLFIVPAPIFGWNQDGLNNPRPNELK